MLAPRGDRKTTSGHPGRLAGSYKEEEEQWGDKKYGWVISMLGRRQLTPRWGNDLVWKLEILGRRQGMLRGADESVWWIWRILGNMEVLGSIHNNKRHILGFKQSLTEARKTTS